jgi:protein-tyrosine phosphatase
VHSHLLPGIDDGCRSIEESLACIRTLLDHGFRGSVCTPHMGVSIFPENNPANTAKQVSMLQQQLGAAGLEYQLWAGGELRIEEDTLSWLRDHGIPALGPSRAVLVDYWGTQWPVYADSVIEQLLQAGYRPILAHPERMDFDEPEWLAVLQRLQQQGVRLQGNLKCLAGHEGPRVGQRAQRLLSDDRYSVLATDLHGMNDIGDRLAGLSVVLQQVGAAKLRQLLEYAPQQLVALAG